MHEDAARRDAWLACYSDELIRGWREVRRSYGDEIAQVSAVYTLRYLPEGNIPGYMMRIGHRHDRAGYSDTRRFTGTSRRNVLVDQNERSLRAETELALVAERAGFQVPSPEGQALARLLLRRAHPRLIRAAVESTFDGAPGAYPGCTTGMIRWYRRTFLRAIGVDHTSLPIRKRGGRYARKA